MKPTRLELTRNQILGYRRRVGALDARLPAGRQSLRRIASAGLQDSMPRAALLSIHARMEGTQSTTWEDPTLVQLWGPRFSVYVVAESDRAFFTVGRLSDDATQRREAEDLADRLEALLAGSRMRFGEAARAMGLKHPNQLRYAASTGRVLLRWDGARQPEVWTVTAPDANPDGARLELARRYMHVFGPTTPESFARWAGIKPSSARARFDKLETSSVAVRTPIGDAFILGSDEAEIRSGPGPEAPVRLLPSGDAYCLLQGDDRELLVTDPENRKALWTSRVWPGALLVDGEIAGSWRRSKEKVVIQVWRRLSPASRKAVELEAMSLPIPDAEDRGIVVNWDD